MMVTAPARPGADEHTSYYGRYIALVPDGDLVATLERQGEETAALLAAFAGAQAHYRPAPGEWNAIEIVGHLADIERIFAYRALRIARRDPKPLEGVDDVDGYVTAAAFAERSLADVAAEFAAVRGASLALFRSLDAAAWARVGTADGNPISVRAIGYIVAGHELHHLPDIRRQREQAEEEAGSTAVVRLRDVVEDDLPLFFIHQQDPIAAQMVGFPVRERAAFMAHWGRILGDDTGIEQTILLNGQVAGYIVAFEQSGARHVGYWLGRDHWGKGVATAALTAFLARVEARPLYAHVAKHNRASLRVLEKCGFVLCDEGEEGDELALQLRAGARGGEG